MKKLVFLSLALLLAGCATIVSGTQQTIMIDTPHVENATCTLRDSKNGSWYLQSTPGSVTVVKGNGPMNIVCKKAGHATMVVSVDEAVSGATFGNIILGGGIGIFIDAASGAAQKYPDKIVLWMKPNHFASESARKEWLAEKADFDRQVAEAEAAKKKASQRTNNN